MITIHLLGDSLVKAYGNDTDNFIGGWGDHLESFFDSKEVRVLDYAEGGRSTRSFLNEGRFIDNGLFNENIFPYGMGPAYDKIQKGDYCLLEFCHNDDNSKDVNTYVDRMTALGIPDEKGIYPTLVPTDDMMVSTENLPAEYEGLLKNSGMSEADIEANLAKYKEILSNYNDKYYPYACGATYKGYYKFYIDKIREKGAIPVIVTAPARQYFKDGKIESKPGHHGGSDKFGDFTFIRATRQIASEENVPIVELFNFSRELFEMLGEEDASYLSSIVGNDNQTIGESIYGRAAHWPEEYDKYREEGNFLKVDKTHSNRLGSFIFAKEIARELVKECKELAAFKLEKPSKQVLAPKRIEGRLGDIEKFMKEYASKY
ncbi:SGNH/GDSL hydrolase family protein [Lachnospira pectinoschiza]|uniref:Rhamnogalacturonan acetylesterase rhgT n=1 Tax=Lachnospira pectinoschiza TaxID=28052 RepID=A0A1G9U3T6_9FIRM|nr:hypothetical protein [Lachnospira pectinoschiza]SDM54503.1 hypothetical protein SAMN05216544_0599 [Lachnospira pectinoschiza]